MKKLFLGLLPVISIMGFANAQFLTADDMISKSNCTSFECYNEFIIKKGFSYESSPKVENASIYIFFSDNVVKTSNPKVTTKNSAIITLGTIIKSTCVGFRTTDKAYYQKLLIAFKTKGFTLVRTTPNTKGGIESTYKSEKYPNIYLTINVDKQDKENETWTGYDFAVERYLKEDN